VRFLADSSALEIVFEGSHSVDTEEGVVGGIGESEVLFDEGLLKS
jgi:hypothetical protein